MSPCRDIVKEVSSEVWAQAVILSRDYVVGMWAHVRILAGSLHVSSGPL
jgi:hypothetical protein